MSRAPSDPATLAVPRPTLEHEIKLLATATLELASVLAALRAAGVRVGDPTTGTQEDTYLDGPGGELRAAKVALRRRVEDQRTTWHWKAEGHRVGARHVRPELEVEGRRALPRTAAELPPALRDRIEPQVFGRRLRSLVTLRTTRTRVAVRLPGTAAAELCFDAVVAASRGRPPLRFVEVEIEHAAKDSTAWQRIAALLTRNLDLTISTESKLARALRPATGHGVPATRVAAGVPPSDPPTAPRSLSYGAFARGVVLKHLDKAARHEPAVRGGDDPDAVHDFRVALRRVRSALRSFGDAFLPADSERAGRHYRDTARALNGLRDLDVFLAHLPTLARALPPKLAQRLPDLEALLGRRRAKAHREALRALRAPERLRAAERWRRRFEAGRDDGRAPSASTAVEAQPSGRPAADVVGRVVIGLAKRVRKRGKGLGADSRAGEFHRLRIAVKRLRYGLDAVESIYGRRLRALVTSLARLQDLLGAANDAAVQSEDLRRWVGAASRHDEGLVLLVATLRDRLAKRAEKARRRFLALWARTGGHHLVEKTTAVVGTPNIPTGPASRRGAARGP